MPHNSLQVRLLKSYLNDFCHDSQPRLSTLISTAFTDEDQWKIKSMSSLTRLWLKAHKEAGTATVCHAWNQIRTGPALSQSTVTVTYQDVKSTNDAHSPPSTRNEGQPQSQHLTLRFERCTSFPTPSADSVTL